MTRSFDTYEYSLMSDIYDNATESYQYSDYATEAFGRKKSIISTILGKIKEVIGRIASAIMSAISSVMNKRNDGPIPVDGEAPIGEAKKPSFAKVALIVGGIGGALGAAIGISRKLKNLKIEVLTPEQAEEELNALNEQIDEETEKVKDLKSKIKDNDVDEASVETATKNLAKRGIKGKVDEMLNTARDVNTKFEKLDKFMQSDEIPKYEQTFRKHSQYCAAFMELIDNIYKPTGMFGKPRIPVSLPGGKKQKYSID